MAIVNAGTARTLSAHPADHTNYSAMAMVTTLFFAWGFCTVLNDAVIPHLQSVFDLSYVQASLIQLAFFSSYFVFALPAGKLVEWIGYQRTMVVGLVLMASGALLFVPAASVATYGFFLCAEVVLAAGVTVLQVAANPYVTILGPPETASSRLNLTQAFNTLGDSVAPYIGGVLILGGAAAALPRGEHLQGAALTAYRIQQAASIKLPFIAIASAATVLALAVALYRFPRIAITREFRPADLSVKQEHVWNHPHLYLGAIGIFIYVGAEVSIGSYMVKYFADPTIAGLPLERAAKLVTFYWFGMMVGRFIGSAAMQRIAANKMLAWSGLGAGLLVLCLTARYRLLCRGHDPCRRSLQLHHVSHHLHAGGRRVGPPHRARVRLAGTSHRWRSGLSGVHGIPGRQVRHPPLAADAAALLSICDLLRLERLPYPAHGTPNTPSGTR